MPDILPRIPIADWIDQIVDWLMLHMDVVFTAISKGLRAFVEAFVGLLNFPPSIVIILIFVAVTWKICRWRTAVFVGLGLLLIDNIGYWTQMIDTLVLVLTSVLLAIGIGIPLGIWVSRKNRARDVVMPLLDFMQTMPAFVYLIPAILFFNVGVVPGVFASVIFAMPPTIRLTNLGIRQVPYELIEASDAFGATSRQKLFKVQLPLALPTIMAGINQSVMLALSMVVVASLVGAPGLGAEVYRAVGQIQVGRGFEAGLAIVIVAIMLDRISQNLYKKKA